MRILWISPIHFITNCSPTLLRLQKNIVKWWRIISKAASGCSRWATFSCIFSTIINNVLVHAESENLVVVKKRKIIWDTNCCCSTFQLESSFCYFLEGPILRWSGESKSRVWDMMMMIIIIIHVKKKKKIPFNLHRRALQFL